MPMRPRLLAGQDHLVGGDQGTRRRDAVALGRVAHHQIAPLRELGVDQPPGGVQRALANRIAPVLRLEVGMGLAPKDRLVPVDPPRGHLDTAELGVEVFERSHLGNAVFGGHGVGSVG